MITDGRDNPDDWYLLENLQNQKDEPMTEIVNSLIDPITVRKRTKDFIEHELHAMSTLSLYDDSVDKVMVPGEADK